MEKLLEFFEGIIDLYKSEIEELKSNIVDDSDDSNKMLIKNLKKDVKNIINYSDLELLNIVNMLQLDEEKLESNVINEMLTNIDYKLDSERKNVLFNILQIKYLYEYEEELSEDQVNFLKDFVKKIKTIINEIKNQSIRNKSTIKRLEEKIKGIDYLTKSLNNNSIVSSYDSVRYSIEDSNLKTDEKMQIIKLLIDNNKSIYFDSINSNDLSSKVTNIKRERVKLNREELEALLNIYGYSLNDLYVNNAKNNEDKFIEQILTLGNINNIKEIFECLKQRGIDKSYFDFNNNKHKSIFSSLLSRSSAKTINEVFDLALENGISKEMLMRYPKFLIEQDNEHYMAGSEGPSEDVNNGFVYGKAGNFIKNIKYLKSKGFDVTAISEKAMSIFESSTSIVKYNFELIKMYGIQIPPLENRKRSFAYSCLEASIADEIIDNFIETSKGGYKYISNFQSRLLSPDSNNTAFFHIHKEAVNNDGSANISHYTRKILDKDNSSVEDRKLICDAVEVDVNNKNEYDKIVKEKTKERKRNVLENKIDFSTGNILYDYDILSDNVVKVLNETCTDKDNSLAYSLNGVSISKNKFLKVYNALKEVKNENNQKDIVIYSLTYNSIITKEELLQVKKAVDEIMETRRLG